ncbi:hypothetical protein [Moorena producens]|uniref:hypothetical protein n=1 Tax=Moorena producens TaxID=1155739 RepID=UPI0011EA6CAD|nr:hypothetical protein [Moorena producens]
MEWASGVELASCQFHAYFRAGRMPTLLLFSAKTDATPFQLGSAPITAITHSPRQVIPLSRCSYPPIDDFTSFEVIGQKYRLV